MAEKNVLRMENVTMQFGGVVAVNDLSLDVPEGKIVALIGPNGAGKTTIFNLLTGVYQPTRGSVLINGIDIKGMPIHKVNKLGIARTFQNIRLFSDMTALDNVKVGMHNEIKCSFLASLLRLPSYYRAEAAANMKATLVAHAGMEEKNFYDVSDLQSTVKAMQEDLSIPAFKEVKYNPFQPTLHASSSITQGIAQADIPMLSGFYYSQLKDGATTIISKGSAPIYAHWNYGKGMVGSFMCDLNGTWSADFIVSEEGAEIINRIISLLANPSEDP